jgi:hypothetical protein
MKLGYLQGSSNDAIYAWARQLVDDLNREPSIAGLPTFEDDAAAAAGNVSVGDGYVTPAGIMRRRMT